ncbi:MAG: heme biosynthesis HemY N-terminal domain-containing protein [Rickettsiales bacterium]
MKFFVHLVLLLSAIAALTLSVYWLHMHPGVVTLDWMGYRITATASLLGGTVVLLALTAMLVTYLLSGFAASLRHYRLSRNLTKRDAGMDAMTRAMVLMATGDHKNAARYVERSAKQLGPTPLVSMLRASIARREGNAPLLAKQLELMLHAPSTQPLAAMSLAAEHKASNRLDEAASVIEQAAKKGTMERGTAHVLLDIYHRQKRWQEMESLLVRMQKNRFIDKDSAHHVRAIMHFLQAEDTSNPSASLMHIETAHHLDAGFIPATVELCRRLDGKHQKRMLAVLKRSWKRLPHPDLARIFFLKMNGESERSLTSAAKALAHQWSEHAESHLLLAEAAIRTKDWDQARNYLKAALSKEEQVRIYQMLATLEQESTGDRQSVMSWLSKATHAKPSPAWNCTTCGSAYETWKPICPQCDSFATLAWNKPMQLHTALPLERLLTA